MPSTVPEPPASIHSTPLPFIVKAAGQEFYRIHRTVFGPKYFGRSGDWRFDCPSGSYGTLYAACSENGCFVETLLRGLNSLVAESELRSRSLCRFKVLVDLRLVCLHGPQMSMIGANASVSATPDYTIPQMWSHALYSHPEAPDGILYRSNYDNDEHVLVLFERAASKIDDGITTPIMADPIRLGKILDHYKAALR